MSSAAKVGAFTIAAAMIASIFYFMVGSHSFESGREITIKFQTVSGLQERAPVYLSGVKIGHVSELELVEAENNRVAVKLFITNNEVKLYGNNLLERGTTDKEVEFEKLGYTYTVTGNLMGDKWIEIIPGILAKGAPPLVSGAVVEGQDPVSIDELTRVGSEVMGEMERSLVAVNALIANEEFILDVEDTMHNVKEITSNVNIASQHFNGLLVTFEGRVNQVADNLNGLSAQVSHILGDVQEDAQLLGSSLGGAAQRIDRLVARNEDEITRIVANLEVTSGHLASTMAAVETLANDENLSNDILATTNNVRRLTQEIHGIASDLRSVTHDEQVQEDLRKTIENTRKASDSVVRVSDKVAGVVDGDGLGKLYAVDLQQEWNLRNGDASTNLNAFLLPTGPYGLKVGVDALGHENLVNFQAMKNFDDKWRLRAGVVRSDFGVGADTWLFDRSLEMSLDAYDTRDIKLDLTGKWLLKNDFFVTGGYREIFGPGGGYPIIGGGKRF